MTIISKIISKVKRWRRNNESDGNNDTTSIASAGSNNNAIADEANSRKGGLENNRLISGSSIRFVGIAAGHIETRLTKQQQQQQQQQQEDTK